MVKIIFVSDFFYEDLTGGAEISLENLINTCPLNFEKIKASGLTLQKVSQNKYAHWVFGNFTHLSDDIKFYFINNKLNYSIVEFDNKFCIHRSIKRHELIAGNCDCDTSVFFKKNFLFFANAKIVFYMSKEQKKIANSFSKHFTKINSVVLSSIFSEKEIQYLKKIRKDEKSKVGKYCIVASSNIIKGKKEAEEYAKENNLEYDLIYDGDYFSFLEKMSNYKGLIFLPTIEDTCPRLVIEAKLLGLDIQHINENVLHQEEKWFNDSLEEIEKYLLDRKDLFFTKILKHYNVFLKSKIDPAIKISFANQVYNQNSQFKKYIECCYNFECDFLDEIVVINHRSTDGLEETLKNNIEKFKNKQIDLLTKRENRDFSSTFTIADLFNLAVFSCKNEIVFRHDADFIFNQNYIFTVYESILQLTLNKNCYAVGHNIPLVKDRITIDSDGVVQDHGDVINHPAVPRTLLKKYTKCEQRHPTLKQKELIEWFYPTSLERRYWKIVNHHQGSLISIDIKNRQDRIERMTMNSFFTEYKKYNVKNRQEYYCKIKNTLEAKLDSIIEKQAMQEEHEYIDCCLNGKSYLCKEYFRLGV